MFRIAKHSAEAIIPTRGTDGSAGYDLYALEDAHLDPMSQEMIDTGISIQIPKDCYARVAPRSGLACKYGLHVMAGVVDSDYRATIKVILINLGKTGVKVQKGDRIAQLILEKIYTPEWDVVTLNELTDTSRGMNGFGSTGR